MLLNFQINNFEVFNQPVELSLEASLHTKKFLSNVVQAGQGNALKSVAIYGANNTGKTCIVDAIKAYRDVLLNRPFRYRSNLFTASPVIELGSEFLYQSKRYRYQFKYDTKTNTFVSESFLEIEIDEYGNRKQNVYFERNTVTKNAQSSDENLRRIINLSSKDNVIIYSLETSGQILLEKAKKILQQLGKRIVVLSMDRLTPFKTIEILKAPDSPQAKQVVSLIKNADLDIEDFKYSDDIEIELETEGEDRLTDVIKNSDKLMDQLRLISVHRGKPLPSFQFDSYGTKKIISLASYLVEAIDKGNIIVLDELDSGLHFMLSRAIVSFFNSLLNDSAQLICTTHDVSLLDIKRLFRKEQIWFTAKDEEQAYLYSLSDFTAESSGIRSGTDLYEKYRAGMLGALPDPSLVDVLLQIKGGNAP